MGLYGGLYGVERGRFSSLALAQGVERGLEQEVERQRRSSAVQARPGERNRARPINSIQFHVEV